MTDDKKEPVGSTDVSGSFKSDGDGKLPDNITVAKEDKKTEKQYDYKKSDFKPKSKHSEDSRNFIIKNYDKQYKKLLVIPSAIVALTIIILLFSFYNTGEFFQKDVSIKGGVTITILQTYDDLDGLEKFLTDSLGTTVNTRLLSEAGAKKGIILDAGIESDEEVSNFLSLIQEKTGELSTDQYSVQVIGSSLGASFFKAVIVSIFAAFILMALVVFLYFRFAAGKWILLPSLFIIWTVLVDMIGTLAVVSLLDIKVSTAGLAAFLLLIGYSVDTDILLTMRLLKGRQEKIFDRIMNAARTGIFMTVAGMVAMAAGLVFTQSETIRQIMLILLIGLAFDLLHTWLTNAGILRWYLERNMYDTK
ncbi:hypothetical protein CMO88_00420 [Candidatus Woesearchaeota archaeon]|nr:hypothetical protein [Candidatus Woesearchaeota archaeon]|tara:strand:- start:42017 stop:43102 length:1086 start_codon:yes stop_codon:yes gene_type:complete